MTGFVSPFQVSYQSYTECSIHVLKKALWSLPPHSVFPSRAFLGLIFPHCTAPHPAPQDLLLCQLTHCPSVVKSSLDDNRKCQQKYTESIANGSRYSNLLMDYLHYSQQLRLQLDTFTFFSQYSFRLLSDEHSYDVQMPFHLSVLGRSNIQEG